MRRQYTQLDGDEGIYFEKQLEFLKNKVLDVEYPELMARRVFPVDATTDAGAKTMAYHSWDMKGFAKLISHYGDDLPNIEISAKESIQKIFSIGVAFGYSYQDIRAARFTNTALESKKLNAAKRQVMQKENDIVFNGDADAGYEGVLNNSNTNTINSPDGGLGTTNWSTKTPDEIIADISAMVDSIVTSSSGVESPNTLLLPFGQYTLIAQTPRATVSDTTILEFVLSSNPYISEVIPVYNLADAAPVNAAYDSEDIALLYDRNPDKLWIEVPMDFTAHSAQEKSLVLEIPCESRTGGIVIAYPKSLCQMNGI